MLQLMWIIHIFAFLIGRIARADQACSDPVDIQTYLALSSLFNATQGNNWTYANSSAFVHKWNFSSVADDKDGAKRPCKDNWTGLTCTKSLSSVREAQCTIVVLDVTYFGLKGYLPDDIANITAIEEMHLSYNHITGTLSSYLGAMTSIEKLFIRTTDIYGSIPSELGLLVNCVSIELVDNYLTGTLPPELVGMSELKVLYLLGNMLSGSISDLRFPLLTTLAISSNQLTGSILSLLSAETPLLTTLDISTNSFSGTVSSDLSTLDDLALIEISENHFSGSLPTDLGLLTNLHTLLATFNLLHGEIPIEICFLNLTHFQLGENRISGVLPTQLGLLQGLVDFDVFDNILTGIIPTELGNLAEMIILYLNSNYFSGPVPSAICAFPGLREFVIAGNYLTSTLPEQIFSLSVLQLFAVTENYLSGSVSSPSSDVLLNLEFNINYFSGPLTNLFGDNSANQFPVLLLADVSVNVFTGSFPSVLFSLPRLQALVASSNCFRGRLECEEFHHNTLQVLDLSGLSSGTACRHYIISQSILSQSGYFPTNYMEGSVPSCFWSFGNLTSLYLDGNGFAGSIGPTSSVLRSPKLTNLNLASNQLTGTIPQFITSHSDWASLDLSSNRLHGHVADLDICSATNQIDVSVNRLSGHLSLTDACDWGNLSSNILEDNLFTYSVDKLASATYFEAMTFYGSYTLDAAMACAAPVLLLAFLLSVGTRIHIVKFQLVSILQQWNDRWRLGEPENDGWWIFLVPISCIIVYNSLLFLSLKFSSSNASTHANQYSWLLSAAYLHGALATILIIVPLTLCVGCAHTWGYNAVTDRSAQDPSSSTSQISKEVIMKVGSAIETYEGGVMSGVGVVSGLFLINLVVIGAANTGYLIAVLDNTPHITLVQVSLSVFKLSWNLVFVKNSLDFLKRSSAKSVVNPLLFRFVIKLFNFVIVPCIATVLVSDSCFLKLFQQQAAPTLYAERCDGVRDFANGTIVCLGPTINDFTDGTLNPAFIYSYQCSSALITNYVPVLLYSYAITGFLLPVNMVIFMLISNDGDGTLRRIARRIEKWSPRLLHQSMLATERISPWSLFPAEALMGTALLSSTLFCTFGLAFPYLGAVIACGLVFEVWAWLIAVGKQLQLQFSGTQQAAELVPWKSLVAEFTNRITLTQLVIIAVVTFAFWAGMLFDMIADVYGTSSGLTTVLVVVFVGPSITVLPGLVRIFGLTAFTGGMDRQLAADDNRRLGSRASVVDERYSLNKSNLVAAPHTMNSDFHTDKL
jgi:hypothetical protein